MNNRNIPFSPPDISELEIKEITNTLRSGWITTGPRTKLLERRLAAYIKTGKNDISINDQQSLDEYSNKVVCLNSATAAEELNLRVLGIKEGDEVIVPAYTYTASASAAIHCGATVKFVDIKKDGDTVTHLPEMDYDELEKAIGPQTKAIIAVDYGGIPCNYDRIFDIVERKRYCFTPIDNHNDVLSDLSSRIQKTVGRVFVVADCAHSLGASRLVSHHGVIKTDALQKKYCGAIADWSSFSFHAVKNFTTAEGGASTWRSIPGIDDAEIYKMFQLLSLHGQNKDAFSKTLMGSWEYDIVGPWYKCNMTDIMAAIGLCQLDRYPYLLARRREIVEKYDDVCDELGLFHLNQHVEGVNGSDHLYIIRCLDLNPERRDAIIRNMAEYGVSTNVHYKPLPMMTAYKALRWRIEAFPNAYNYYQNLISLPLHTKLSDEDVDYICTVLKKVFRKHMS